MTTRRTILASLVGALLAGCGGSTTGADVPLVWDQGPSADLAAGDPGTDPGATDPDTQDQGPSDPGTMDVGAGDPGQPDLGGTDQGLPDLGIEDLGTTDPGEPDAGTPDPGLADPGAGDPGEPDLGPGDPGPADVAAPDYGDVQAAAYPYVQCTQDQECQAVLGEVAWCNRNFPGGQCQGCDPTVLFNSPCNDFGQEGRTLTCFEMNGGLCMFNCPCPTWLRCSEGLGICILKPCTADAECAPFPCREIEAGGNRYCLPPG